MRTGGYAVCGSSCGNDRGRRKNNGPCPSQWCSVDACAIEQEGCCKPGGMNCCFSHDPDSSSSWTDAVLVLHLHIVHETFGKPVACKSMYIFQPTGSSSSYSCTKKVAWFFCMKRRKSPSNFCTWVTSDAVSADCASSCGNRTVVGGENRGGVTRRRSTHTRTAAGRILRGRRIEESRYVSRHGEIVRAAYAGN